MEDVAVMGIVRDFPAGILADGIRSMTGAALAEIESNTDQMALLHEIRLSIREKL